MIRPQRHTHTQCRHPVGTSARTLKGHTICGKPAWRSPFLLRCFFPNSTMAMVPLTLPVLALLPPHCSASRVCVNLGVQTFGKRFRKRFRASKRRQRNAGSGASAFYPLIGTKITFRYRSGGTVCCCETSPPRILTPPPAAS